MKRWMIKQNKADIKKIAQQLNISEITACVMANRGVGNAQAAQYFLYGSKDSIRDPSGIKDMEKAVYMVLEAIRCGEKIAVYGDYDVDGVMSTVILYETIKKNGGDVIFYVPHRQKEGYGLNPEAVEFLADRGINLLVTCDNGIAAMEEIALAKKRGLKVIVIDHHEPAFTEDADGKKVDVLPPADAVIDPKQTACTYPFSYFCAGGLAYQFSALFHKVQQKPFLLEDEMLVFAAIATICDIVDLVDENRILAKEGLKRIETVENIGLKALIFATGLGGKQINEHHVGFVLGPSINATGRLESARKAIQLFTTEDKEEAYRFACELYELNTERKSMTQEAADRIGSTLQAQEKIDPVIVFYDDQIHESIAGIVAGRVKERFYHPTIILTKSEQGVKGSGRSIEKYNMFEALFRCKDLFQRFGGHAMAAGVSLPQENIPELRRRLNRDCRLKEEDFQEVIRIEKEVDLEELSFDLLEELDQLSPFGKENPAPLFAKRNLVVERVSLIGKNQNVLRFQFLEEESGCRMKGISFHLAEKFINLTKELYGEEKYCKIMNGRLKISLDIIYSPAVNEYDGERSLQLFIKDFRFRT